MKTLTLKHNNNFAILNEEFANEICKNGNPAFVFIYRQKDKESISFILRIVDISFTQQTQCGCVHYHKGEHLFENLCPENQQIFYELGLQYNKDHCFNIKAMEKGEYKLCKESQT